MKSTAIIFLSAFLVFLGQTVFAQNTQREAKIVSIQGTLEIKSLDSDWKPAQVDMILKQGDMIRTKANSSATLNVDGMAQSAIVEVTENSQLLLSQLLKDDSLKTENTLLDLSLGKILIKAQKLYNQSSKFEVKTPTSIVSVRGTSFAVEVQAFE